MLRIGTRQAIRNGDTERPRLAWTAICETAGDKPGNGLDVLRVYVMRLSYGATRPERDQRC